MGKEEWEKEKFVCIQLPLRVLCAFSLSGWQLRGRGEYFLQSCLVVGAKVVNAQCSEDGRIDD